jgi:hypothetical protein
MSEAIHPKGDWKWGLVGAFLALAAVLSSSTVAYYKGKEDGIELGLTRMHKMCYNVSQGFVEIDGKAIICGRGG